MCAAVWGLWLACALLTCIMLALATFTPHCAVCVSALLLSLVSKVHSQGSACMGVPSPLHALTVSCVVQTAAILIPAFQQLNGINSITFYAPQLFASIGAGLTGTYGALLSSVVIDAIEMAGTFIGLGTVDK